MKNHPCLHTTTWELSLKLIPGKLIINAENRDGRSTILAGSLEVITTLEYVRRQERNIIQTVQKHPVDRNSVISVFIPVKGPEFPFEFD